MDVAIAVLFNVVGMVLAAFGFTGPNQLRGSIPSERQLAGEACGATMYFEGRALKPYGDS